MATATLGDNTGASIGQALVSFSSDGLFPEEDVSSLTLTSDALPGAIRALAEKKANLEGEIHTINEETADDIGAWFDNAKSVQTDMIKSRTLANDILKQAELPDVSGKTIRDAEAKAEFLIKELNYNEQVRQALLGIRDVNQVLDQVEQASGERRILDALHLLEKSWTKLDALPIGRSWRIMKLLDIRAFELKSSVHDVFDHVWNTLVHVDLDEGTLSIQESRETEAMSLSDAVVGLKAYKEVDERMAQLWFDLDRAIVGPRTDIGRGSIPGIHVDHRVLGTRGEADRTVEALFEDLELVFSFLAKNLPAELVQSISHIMVPEVTSRVIHDWLDSAVPGSLAEMDTFEAVISAAKRFCGNLASLNYTGFGELQEWVGNAPKVWLAKCRETALDTVRVKLSQGLGSPKEVERVERQMVSRAEGKHLTENGPSAAADNQDWDAAWSSEDEPAKVEAPKGPGNPSLEEDDGADAWGAWADDEGPTEEPSVEEDKKNAAPGTDGSNVEEEEDPSDAWGWGDDDAKEDVDPATVALPRPAAEPPATREMVLKETYSISSTPEPVLSLIVAILEDGAALTSEVHSASPVAAAAAGLFSLPMLALAMFRAVSPYYYSLDMGGNMFLYNDSRYLAERLAELATSWKLRDDLSPRAKTMLRLDNEIKTLQKFANRSYSSEMNTQKTILRDLLGGLQNLLQQDDAEGFIDAAVSRIRAMAVAWGTILTRSAWCQAVGALVETVAVKVISDVMELPAIGQDEAYNIANLMAKIIALDDLFLPSRVGSQGTPEAGRSDEIPATAQYAPSWLRLQYLSEMLQSNLREVRYLWMEGELSLYFTPDEVVDLINLSFEANARSREVIKDITQHPHPVQM